ncbi:MAG: oligosaccharide flippase family protein [Desulfobacteraceae bacterium]|nr:oligosaccharide flippase family protein [Desulfobacteraceae bacterium]
MPLHKMKQSNGSFLSNTISLVRGDIIAQIIMVSLTPIITRLYLPEAFGLFSILVSIVTVVMPISHLHYNVAVQLPRDETDADSLALLSILLVMATSFLSFIVIFMFSNVLSSLLKIEDSLYILYFIPASIFLGGINDVLNAWHLRMKQFKRLALTKITAATGNRITTLILGLQGLSGPVGLVAGKIAGHLFSNFRLICYQGPRQINSIISLSSLKKIRSVALRYKEFPKYSWSSLLQQTARQLPVFYLGYFFTPAVAGYYALCRNVLAIPTQLIAKGLSKNFYQRTSEAFRLDQDISSNLLIFLKYVVTVVVFPMTLFCLIAVDTFTFIFGPDWQEVGLYAQVLAPMFISSFLWLPFGGLFDLLEKQKERMLFDLSFFAVSIVSLSAGSLLNSPLSAVAIFSFSRTIMNLYRTLWIISKVGIKPAYCVKVIFKVIAVASLFLLPVLLFKIYFTMPIEVVIASLSLSFISYYSFIYMADKYLRNMILSFIGIKR